MQLLQRMQCLSSFLYPRQILKTNNYYPAYLTEAPLSRFTKTHYGIIFFLLIVSLSLYLFYPVIFQMWFSARHTSVHCFFFSLSHCFTIAFFLSYMSQMWFFPRHTPHQSIFFPSLYFHHHCIFLSYNVPDEVLSKAYLALIHVFFPLLYFYHHCISFFIL